MNRLKKYAGVAVLVAVVAALGISSAAFAQETTPAVPAAPLAHGGGGAFCGQAGLDAAAKALKMTTDELSARLWGGDTLSGLADKAGVDIQVVQDAVTAACTQAVRDAIEQAVTNGQLTREHADWLLQGLDKGFWGGGMHGFGYGFGMGRHGFGGGFGGHRGFRGFGVPNNNSTTPNSSGF